MAEETENLKLDFATCEKGVVAVFDNPEKGNYLPKNILRIHVIQ